MVVAADVQGEIGQIMGDARGEAFENGTFGIGVQGADDRHATLGSFEGIVVTDLASEVEIGFLGQGIIQHIATGAGDDSRGRGMAGC